MENNYLTMFPHELWNFPALQELYFYGNDIVEVTSILFPALTFFAPEKVVSLGPTIRYLEAGVFDGIKWTADLLIILY